MDLILEYLNGPAKLGFNPDPTMKARHFLPAIFISAFIPFSTLATVHYVDLNSTNLGAQPAFATIRSNIAGQAGTTSYTDTNATGNGPFFYRVGVQQ